MMITPTKYITQLIECEMQKTHKKSRSENLRAAFALHSNLHSYHVKSGRISANLRKYGKKQKSRNR